MSPHTNLRSCSTVQWGNMRLLLLHHTGRHAQQPVRRSGQGREKEKGWREEKEEEGRGQRWSTPQTDSSN